MIDRDYEYFRSHLEEFLKTYNGKFIAIKDCNVLGAYDTFDDALMTTLKSEPIGTFIVQECSVSGTTVNMFYSNNVRFEEVR